MIRTRYWLALVAALALSACAASGTRVTANDEYRSIARSQQWWCSNAGGCNCVVDGQKATCSLVQTCLSTGACKAVN
jgi:putative hemolysin